MDLRRWHYFAILAEEINFTRAAERLYISQPSLSQQIRVLERELGVPLLDRSGPRFRLTEAGRVAAVEADALSRQLEHARQRVIAAGRGQSGQLRIAHTRSAPGPCASGLVSAFRERYPQVVIQAETGWTSRNIERLDDGEVDVAFVRPPIDREWIGVEIVDVEEVLIALPDGHPLASYQRLDRQQIEREPVVFWSRANGSGWYDEISAQVWPSVPPDVVREEPDDEQLMRAVADGTGLAVVPEHRAAMLRVPGVALRRLTDPPPRTSLGVAYRRDLPVRPVISNFLELARDLLRDDSAAQPLSQAPGPPPKS